MPTKAKNVRPMQDTYLELIRRFPLRPMKNDAEHERAGGIISELMGRRLDSGSSDYLDTLILLVDRYEQQHHAIDESLTPQDALRALMRANQLRQSDIGRIIGSESAVSMFLNGTRGLSKAHARKLAERFKVELSTFIG